MNSNSWNFHLKNFTLDTPAHFDASEGIKNHPIRKYKKKTILEEGVFVGAKALILPGVTLKKNTFVQSGTVVNKSTHENSIVYGNPQKTKKILTEKFISRINNQNKKFHFWFLYELIFKNPFNLILNIKMN